MSNNVNILSIVTLLAIVIIFLGQVLALSTDYWSETEVVNSTTTEHHGLINQCLCEPDCVCSKWDDPPAFVKGSLAALCIGFIITFAVFGLWLAFMLNVGSESTQEKIKGGFFLLQNLMWISFLCAHVVFGSKDKGMMEDKYEPKEIDYKLFWSWGMAIMAQCIGCLLGIMAHLAIRKASKQTS